MSSPSEDSPGPGKPHEDEITSLLLAWRGGDAKALAALMPKVYRQLKDIARRLLRARRRHETLQTTALVHETYLRIIDLERLSWQDRVHFFAMSARLMRRILIDHARHHARDKRGGGEAVLKLDDLSPIPVEAATDFLELDEALRELARHDAQMAHIVELRFFGGLNRDEIAEVLGISSATATRRWRAARAWLVVYMSKDAK